MEPVALNDQHEPHLPWFFTFVMISFFLQSVEGGNIIFLSSLFKKNKNYLGINKFKLISKLTKKKVVALGGISKNNLKKMRLLNCFGFAAISYFE